MALDKLAERLHAAFSQEKYGGLIAQVLRGDEAVLLVKPLTFMNRSGECVARAVRYKNASPADLLVVVDDVNLPLGKLRIRAEGSAGGHNGLKSIIEVLGTEAFSRLRLGVGEGDRDELIDHVLSPFRADERPQRDAMVERAVEAVLVFLAQGITEAINAFN